MEEISLKDRDILEQIKEHTNLISNIYKRLFFEEITQGNKTEEYYSLLYKLETFKKEEEKLYSELELTPQKANNLIGFVISSNNKYQELENNVLTAINSINTQDLIENRIVRQLNIRLYKDKQEYLDWLVESGFFLTFDQAEEYNKFSEVNQAISNDFENAFLFFYTQIIQDSASEKVKDYLTKIKYNLLFLSKNAEDELLYRRGSIPEEIYFSFLLISEINQINKELMSETVETSGIHYCKSAIANILMNSILDEDTQDIEQNVFAQYLKSGLTILLALNNYKDLVKNMRMEMFMTNLITSGEFNASMDFVSESVKGIEKVKSKCNYLHIIPPR